MVITHLHKILTWRIIKEAKSRPKTKDIKKKLGTESKTGDREKNLGTKDKTGDREENWGQIHRYTPTHTHYRIKSCYATKT